MESKGILDTIGILAKVAEDVSWKAKNGCIDAIFSYEEFLGRVKVLGDDIGDPPRCDRYHSFLVHFLHLSCGATANALTKPIDDAMPSFARGICRRE